MSFATALQHPHQSLPLHVCEAVLWFELCNSDDTATDSDDTSTGATRGDPCDSEELVLTSEQEFLYIVWWGIRERERYIVEEVD